MPITLCCRATPFSCSNGLFAKISGKASFCICFLSNFHELYSPWGSKNGINSKIMEVEVDEICMCAKY